MWQNKWNIQLFHCIVQKCVVHSCHPFHALTFQKKTVWLCTTSMLWPLPIFTAHIPTLPSTYKGHSILNLQQRSYMLLTWSHLSLTSSICWTHSIRSTDMSGLNSVTERIASARAWNKESNQLFCHFHSFPRSSWKRKGKEKRSHWRSRRLYW